MQPRQLDQTFFFRRILEEICKCFFISYQLNLMPQVQSETILGIWTF